MNNFVSAVNKFEVRFNLLRQRGGSIDQVKDLLDELTAVSRDISDAAISVCRLTKYLSTEGSNNLTNALAEAEPAALVLSKLIADVSDYYVLMNEKECADYLH